MKVHKDYKGDHDLEVQIERLTLRVRELEDINQKHKKLNADLRKELKDVREALARVSGSVH